VNISDHGQDDALEFNPDPDTVETIRTHLWLQRNARELAEPEGVEE
jgi:hypothetical protein